MDCDWSSDVGSSDLARCALRRVVLLLMVVVVVVVVVVVGAVRFLCLVEIGRASCRERV